MYCCKVTKNTKLKLELYESSKHITNSCTVEFLNKWWQNGLQFNPLPKCITNNKNLLKIKNILIYCKHCTLVHPQVTSFALGRRRKKIRGGEKEN